MDVIAGIQASFSGLHAQRTRMNVIAANLANAQTTRTPAGGPYQPQEVVFSAQPPASPFAALLDQYHLEPGVSEVHVIEVRQNPEKIRLQYDPAHPDANAEGYVAYPDINVMSEMVDLIAASRAYEANVTAINAAKDMTIRALQIGRV